LFISTSSIKKKAKAKKYKSTLFFVCLLFVYI
jgi:hypothetical protein